ncbi:MAG TPA: hypothetical protein VG102_03540 [Candidatus Paceibacterota bacterium]|jgi:hypothetical protein|nr:hypothetical protein [Candidatus Paceibacterota bacterium]
MTRRRLASLLAPALAFAPSIVLASTTTDVVSQIAGLFYIVVGLALTLSILMMGGGIIMWIVRFGTDQTYRTDAIHLMEWGVATLFTLILVLGVAEFVQTHTSATLYILSIAIILLVVWLFATSGVFSGEGKEKEKEKK